MIRFTCPSCGKVASAREEAAGRKAKCPGCGKVLVVPAAPAAKPAATEQVRTRPAMPLPQPSPSRPVPVSARPQTIKAGQAPLTVAHKLDRPTPPPRQASGSLVPLIAGVVAGVVGLGALAGVGLYFLLGAKPTPQPVVQNAPPAVKPAPVINPNPVPAFQPAKAPSTKVALAPKLAVPDKQAVVADPNPPAEQKPEPDKVALAPPKELPTTIATQTTRKVKHATAYLKVTQGNGQTAEGSGFFALQPGIVVTNAHVVGMLQARADKPRSIDVVVNSGDKGETRLGGTVLGVDRQNDLALLRVSGDPKSWPEPLAVDLDMDSLTELQPVYFFGFPLGANLGKEITVGAATIASFRRDAEGLLFQIQLNGTMQPGNSGGPVVDTRGVVIGVSVAIIRQTSINFAVPADKIHGMLHGRVEGSQVGDRFRDKSDVKLPVRIGFLDPLQRIRDVKLTYWTGPQGKARPASLKPPTPVAGDSPPQAIPMIYQQGLAKQDLVLPTLPAGQVYWLRAEFVDQDGMRQWGPAHWFKPGKAPPLDRVPAKLVVNTDSQERSLKIKSRYVFQLSKGKEKIVEASLAELEALEALEKNPKGDAVKLALGKYTFYDITGNRRVPRNPAAQRLVPRGIYGYQTDDAGRLTSFGFITVRNPNPILASEANSMSSDVTTAYQGLSLGMPNREVAPLETWQEKIRLLLEGQGKKKDPLDLVLTCSYQGSRTMDGRTEAVIRLFGEVKLVRPAPVFGQPRDRVDGRALFDVGRGLITELHLSVNTELDLDGIMLSRTFGIDLTRAPGNLYGITMPQANPAVASNPPANPPNVGVAGGRTRVLGGGFGRDPYTDLAPPGALLVGLEVGIGKFVNIDVMHSIRAVFRADGKETLGPQHGSDLTSVTRLLAKPGYAVGALSVKTGANADGLSLTFMRIQGDKLDPSDSYESDWVGDPRPGVRKTLLTGQGRQVVGICGYTSKENNTGIGLVFDRNSTAKDPPASDRPDKGQTPVAGKPFKFSPKNGQYTVTLPPGARTRTLTRTVTIKGLRIPIEAAEVTLSDGTTYTAASMGIPAKAMKQIPEDARLETFRDALTNQYGGRITRETDLKMGEVSGKEFQIAGGRGAVRMQLYIKAGWVIYTIVEGRTRNQVNSPAANAFFDSLKIVENN